MSGSQRSASLIYRHDFLIGKCPINLGHRYKSTGKEEIDRARIYVLCKTRSKMGDWGKGGGVRKKMAKKRINQRRINQKNQKC
jgi:hypothetical protein